MEEEGVMRNWADSAGLVPDDECAKCASVGVRRKASGHIRLGPRLYPQVCVECALHSIRKRQGRLDRKAMRAMAAVA